MQQETDSVRANVSTLEGTEDLDEPYFGACITGNCVQ